ncbi:NADH-quinone oxidoreductase subunit NuoF [Candidatus Poribacteria bacterium]|nr:NADH-quinone oxidoreductase subunit NuoF [Candidatus Poribacteria bacterium]
MKLEKIEDLDSLQREILKGEDPNKVKVRICMTGCRAYGAGEIREAFLSEIKEKGLEEKVDIISTGCHGFCARAPVIVIDPYDIFYQQLTPDDVPEIVSETLLKGEVVERLLFRDPRDGRVYVKSGEVPFYREQTKWVLRNCGKIDPTDIRQYIARGGYSSLAKVLSGMKPEEVIEEVKRSGLRGRGGAGFPTGRKWEFTRLAKGHPKYIICNADEGDPGAFMDRAVLEGDPHSVIEGMLIGAYAIGAQEGYIYVRAEYPIAVEHLQIAIEQAEELGLLGENILGTDFSFRIKMKKGAGAFVCGEETALIASIEGRRGMPRPRPPFPAQSGLWGKPTNINNVETWANIPIIIEKGADEYSKIGTERSKGTKIFALAGKVNNTGLVEVPIGTPLRKVIFDIGGGVPEGRRFKAVQIGGPSGGCIPERHLDLPIDYESLTEAGAIMGSGGMVVMDDATCMVDVARFFMDFIQSESCGKCVPCRIGTKRMLEILERITKGEGREGDVELLEELAWTIKDSALCGLGQTAPNPILSTIRYFRDEYEAHIKEKRCPACACEALFDSPCQHACPAGIDVPGYVSLIAEGDYKGALSVIMERIPFPGVCGRVCHQPCELKCRRSEVDAPVAIKALKRFAADQAWDEYRRELIEKVRKIERREKKVAVIGSGPAGLSAAYHLVRKGYPVTMFESAPVPGGMLSLGIPGYRLPKDIVQREIQLIRDLGVEIRTETPVGEDISLDQIKREFDAVFIAVGAQGSVGLGIPGEDLEGVLSGLELLKKVNLGEKVKLGEKVAVIGGGNVAIDAARVAVRLGASQVQILYRRTRSEMPAIESEIEEAEKEGVRIEYLTSPRRILGGEKVKGLECIRMELGEYDETGRRRPIPVEGSEFRIDLDQVILAIGQRAELPFIEGELNVDPITLATQIQGVFAGGDVATGPATVIEAIAAGERAAISIDRYLRGQDLMEGRLEIRKKFIPPEELEREIEPSERGRHVISSLPVKERIRGFQEVERALSESDAREEAKRCLRCDLEQRRGSG